MGTVMNKKLTDPCYSNQLMSMEEALNLMKTHSTPCKNNVEVKVIDALDYVIDEDVFAPIYVPPVDNSAMDGFAFRYQDKSFDSLKIVGESLAGHPYTGAIHGGECIRIMTGAAVPADADTVLMQEKVVVESDRIKISHWPEKGNSIRRKGEDINIGDKVISQGSKLSPIDLGLLASIGKVNIKVLQKLNVAVFCSGDELVRAGEEKSHTGIYESNSVVITSMLKRLNVNYKDMGVIKDDPSAIRVAFIEALKWADVIITSGGVSVGQADYIKDVLSEMGEIGFWKLAIKPGKPFAYGKLQGRPFFGLPGNPVSATITMHQLVIPVLRQLQGEKSKNSTLYPLPLNKAVSRKTGRKDFQRGVIQQGKDGLELELKSRQSSGILSSMSQADGYVIFEPDCEQVNVGESLEYLPFDAIIGKT